MKKAIESARQVKDEDQVFSGFSVKEILSLQSMGSVRGGDGDGSTPIIIIPPPPK